MSLQITDAQEMYDNDCECANHTEFIECCEAHNSTYSRWFELSNDLWYRCRFSIICIFQMRKRDRRG